MWANFCWDEGKIFSKNKKIQNGRHKTGASSPPRQPRQLPWLIFETVINYKK